MNLKEPWVDHPVDHPTIGPAERPRGGRGLLAIPVLLVVAITAACLYMPAHTHLGPLVIIAPAFAASFARPRVTALIGALAVAALALIVTVHGWQATTNPMAQLISVALLSVLVVLYSSVWQRRGHELSRVRSVADAAQRVLLRPPPRRIGPLRVAWLYLTAEDETRIGGDLFAVTRGPHTGSLLGSISTSLAPWAARAGATTCSTPTPAPTPTPEKRRLPRPRRLRPADRPLTAR
ncbi:MULTISPECIES: hypothetical protein [unclassified Streptomyces]|uniref:hypothetical protein n=1 Tax=unclassified Streptomyces TaxID=2593676 RepID=UPI00081D969A|nr:MULTISPECIES: hypothetical protein [unclassified Streptomyces]MYZ39136.1 hypothetical protein [Streptomyces sp. SID4917]SCG02327.1 hypothetical protein GA0115259_107724 [Streptomyces sp. MnatMP-M17]